MYKENQMKRSNSIGILATLFFLMLNNAGATIFHVTNSNDTGPGSLREQVSLALDYDTIQLDFATNGIPIVLNSEIDISVNLMINGNSMGNSILDGNNTNRIFRVTPSGSLNVSILNIINGNSGSSNGGAIFSEGGLYFFFCTFDNNQSSLSGGAIYTTADLLMDRCTMKNNIALVSGGALFSTGNNLWIESSTFYNNEADDAGGAIFCNGTSSINLCTISGNSVISKGGGVYNEGNLEIQNSTIVYNSSALVGGGINNEIGTLLLFNTILANNSASGLGSDGFNNLGAILNPLSNYNAISSTNSFGLASGLNNQLNVDVELGPLEYNNIGMVETHMLLCGSHGINEGHSNFPISYDQNGRVRDSIPDIGACEYFSNTFTVLNTNDAGTGSLREMISLACTGDTIRFAAATNGIPILLASELSIDKKIHIVGNGNDLTIISGNNVTRIFSVLQMGNLHLSLLDLKNAFVAGGFGGAINNSGEVHISRCNMYDNICEESGGVIATTGILTIDNSDLSNNGSTLNTGGAIYSDEGFVTLTNTTLNGNEAFVFGAAIFSNDTTILSNCTISGNICASPNGGGINSDGYLSLTNCTVTQNSDGIWNAGGILFLVNTLVAGNAGINIRNTGSIDPASRNNAIGDASVNGMPSGNQNYYNVTPDLGPLGNYGGYTLTHSLRCNNVYCADRADVTAAPMYDQRGIMRYATFSDIGSFENHFQNSYQVINTNDSGPGSLREAVANSCDTAFIYFHPSLNGDTIFLQSPIDVKVHAYVYGNGTQNTVISGNSTTRIFNIWSDDTLDLSDLVLIDGNSGINNGGCIYNDGCLQARNVKFVNNQSNGNGGAIYNNFVTQINHSTFELNRANGSSGGAIFQSGPNGTELIQCTLDSNYATGQGGAVYGSDNTVITNCTFSSNHSDVDGGAVHMTGFSDLVGCSLTLNSAGGSGGGLNIASGATVYLKNTIIADNSSAVNGPDGNNAGAINNGSLSNLIGNNSDFNMPSGQGNILDQAAMLDVLADNGGLTMTHALLCGSPAINNASTQFIYPTDQRDTSRVGLPDIGAFEFTDINTGVIVSNGTISAVQTGALYQWLDCSTNTIIVGQTSISFAPGANGSFAMIITNNGCTDTSNCVNVTIVGINQNDLLDGIKLFPNPVHSKLTVNLNSKIDFEYISVINATGQLMEVSFNVEGNTIDFNTTKLQAGVYFVELRNKDQIFRKKFIKEL